MANDNSGDPLDNVGDDIGDEIVLITGSSGHIGSAVIERLAGRYTLVGLDRPGPPNPDDPAHCIPFDITSEDSVASAISEVREKFGPAVAADDLRPPISLAH